MAHTAINIAYGFSGDRPSRSRPPRRSDVTQTTGWSLGGMRQVLENVGASVSPSTASIGNTECDSKHGEDFGEQSLPKEPLRH